MPSTSDTVTPTITPTSAQPVVWPVTPPRFGAPPPAIADELVRRFPGDLSRLRAAAHELAWHAKIHAGIDACQRKLHDGSVPNSLSSVLLAAIAALAEPHQNTADAANLAAAALHGLADAIDDARDRGHPVLTGNTGTVSSGLGGNGAVAAPKLDTDHALAAAQVELAARRTQAHHTLSQLREQLPDHHHILGLAAPNPASEARLGAGVAVPQDGRI